MGLIGRCLLALAGAIALVGCGQAPPEGFEDPPAPALWEVSGPQDQRGWLFGTIHALPDGVAWRTPELDGALDSSGALVVEVANLADTNTRAEEFAEMAMAPESPPLPDRVPADQRRQVTAIMDREGLPLGQFHRTQTWAAALMLAQASSAMESGNGVDRALIDDYGAGTVIELEGSTAQLAIFAALPEIEQRDLLSAVVTEADRTRDPLLLAKAWYAGDTALIETEQQRGILADPELREALLVQRNRDWIDRVAAMLDSGQRPFVAVGAAHVVGPDGLVEMLEARGYTVTRVQ